MIPTLYHRAARWTAAVLAGWLTLTGQPRISDGAEEASRREAARAESPCVLLRNGNVLFGRCREQGEWVIVTSGDDNRIRLPRRDVAAWAQSLRQLYQHRLDHQRRGDIDVQLDNVRWCLRYDLFDSAAAELRKIYRRDPEHAEAKRLEQRLRRQAARPRPTLPAEPDTSSGAGQPAEEDHAATEGESAPTGGSSSEPDASSESSFDLDTLQAFTHQVQPMLINRCGQCHSHTSERQWRLIVPAGGTRASARITRENLASLGPYLDLGAALESELLERAVSAHGHADTPPLGPSEAAAIDGLKSWLQQIRPASAPPESSQETRSATPAGAAPPGQHVNPVRPQWPLARQDNAPPMAGELAAPSSQAAGSPIHQRPESVPGTSPRNPDDPSLKRPARLPPVDNPFDPKLFNRRYRAK